MRTSASRSWMRAAMVVFIRASSVPVPSTSPTTLPFVSVWACTGTGANFTL
jgi:hypothetical protein